MNIGKLNKRVSIQTKSTAQDALGSPVDSWATVYECWAGISSLSGKQINSANQFISKSTSTIEIRYHPSLAFQPNQRIQYTDALSTHTYEIEFISNPDQANKTLTFYVYELEGQQ